MKKNKILLIEDDKSLIKILKKAINTDEYEIVLAVNADQGFRLAKEKNPNVIVLDVLMPGKTGFDCLRQLKNEPKTKKIPVIILSNLGQDEEIRLAISLGASGYLVKANFTIDEVIKKITKAIK